MAVPEKLAALVDSLVIPDRDAPKGLDADATTKTLTAILEGGKDNIVGLVDMLAVPDKADDSKARYALHALAVRLSAGEGRQRRAFAEALASTLDGKRPAAVQVFVIRQLQVAGGQEVAGALGKLLLDEELCDPAVQALLAIKAGAAEQLRAALPKASGRPRLSITQALGSLRDRASAGELRKLAADKDQDVRLLALWALANIGDAGSVDVLLKATDATGYERTKAASACLLLAERLRAAGGKADASRIYTHLRDRYTSSEEAHVQEAAKRGLAGLK